MKFQSSQFGTVFVAQAEYPNGALAVLLECIDPEVGYGFRVPLGKLSTNLGGLSEELPERCFHAKEWSENETLATEALASGLFRVREDMPIANSGYMGVRVWEIVA